LMILIMEPPKIVMRNTLSEQYYKPYLQIRR
jgi:hypothetical protein